MYADVNQHRLLRFHVPFWLSHILVYCIYFTSVPAMCIGTTTGERRGRSPPSPQCNFGHFSKSPRSADFFKGRSDVISILQAQTIYSSNFSYLIFGFLIKIIPHCKQIVIRFISKVTIIIQINAMHIEICNFVTLHIL